MKKKRKKGALRDYRSGTFDKRVAYGQRERKLTLVARGVMPGFRVLCKTENSAKNLAYSLRVRAARIELADFARFGLKVKVEGRKVYVRRTQKPGFTNQL